MANSQRGKRVQLGPVRHGYCTHVNWRSQGRVHIQTDDSIEGRYWCVDLTKEEARNLLEWLKEELVD